MNEARLDALSDQITDQANDSRMEVIDELSDRQMILLANENNLLTREILRGLIYDSGVSESEVEIWKNE